MIRDIVVPMTSTAADSDALDVALDLATHHQAHLTVLEMLNLPLPTVGPWGFVSEISLGNIYEKLREQGRRNAEALRERLRTSTVSHEVRLVEAPLQGPLGMAAQCAQYGDLSVLAGAHGDTAEAETTRAYFGALLLESGRPVLVVPSRCKVPVPSRRAVVGWRPTPDATRALHDALPLLRTAAQVDVVMVDPMDGAGGEGDEPGAEIATHLARHGLKVDVVSYAAGHRDASAVLLDHVRRVHADLLVVGGYGHSKLREWAMGGMTRELLFGAHIPVLFSH
ncbi:universal stress protein [Coralloluteibacterium stylophorae]|uniref:Universal stress protein n=1 Tax=Coralloluteibacterium stylophorae TaxID=1776034 RepID=A0A8J8B0J9_9GAMM|nr:universal stress protein [Coralloluteibacterium stylophorae]MBS7455573.1 universal stress protein [Coralloluteibacterium stylophorae]